MLDQSYRLPRSAYDLAMNVVRRIRHRKQKHFKSMDRQGSVSHHLDTFDIDMRQGSWTLMSRTNSFCS